MKVSFEIANSSHVIYAQQLTNLYAASAEERKTGIAIRQPAYIAEKMSAEQAIIALYGEKLVGFCYIESWSETKYVANSGLIIHPDYRRKGYGKQIKKLVFQLARDKYPNARVFGITTSLAVMNMNSDLGYKPVTFSELTQDEKFWNGCKSCPNYDILERNERKLCLCTGMLAPSKNELLHKDLSNLVLENKKP